MPTLTINTTETLLRHKELLLLNTFITESAAEVEQQLEEIRDDSSDPDWQYLKGQKDALREVAREIRKIMGEDDQQYDRFRMTPAGDVLPVLEVA